MKPPRREENWTAVASLDDLREGDLAEVSAGADVILLAYLPGAEVRAYQGICPHSEYPLANGDLDGDVLTCAGHLWEFDLRTRGCRISCRPMRLGRIRGSSRRAGPAAEPGHSGL
jgi:toluene monooxygenase system ferredoxin subunit